MADHYSTTSFSIDTTNHEFLQDLIAIFSAYENENIKDAPEWFQIVFDNKKFDILESTGIDCHLEKDSLWITSEYYVNVFTIADIIQAALNHYDLDIYVGFQVAHTCSKLYTDVFGGTGVFITKNKIEIFDTASWLESKIQEYQSKD